jgi:DNA invertase Pin-like site-specific DNA recombinase
MAVIGYARISTPYQSLELQIQSLNKHGCEKIYSETVSGAKTLRPQFQACLDYLRAGDTIVVWKLDRLARTLKELLHLIKYFEDHEIHFVSLTENIDTKTAIGKFAFHMCASMIEFERDVIRERVTAGLKASRKRGRKGGRKYKFDKNKRERIYDLYEVKQMPASEVGELFGIKRHLVYKYVRELKTEKKNLELSLEKLETGS